MKKLVEKFKESDLIAQIKKFPFGHFFKDPKMQLSYVLINQFL